MLVGVCKADLSRFVKLGVRGERARKLVPDDGNMLVFCSQIVFILDMHLSICLPLLFIVIFL